jgi:hypothetical protein
VRASGCDLRDGNFRVRESCSPSGERSRRHRIGRVLETGVSAERPGRITGAVTGIKSPVFRAQVIESSGDFFGEKFLEFLGGLAETREGVFDGVFAGRKSPARRAQVVDFAREFVSEKFFAFDVDVGRESGRQFRAVESPLRLAEFILRPRFARTGGSALPPLASGYALPSPKRSFGFAQAGKASPDLVSNPPKLQRRRIVGEKDRECVRRRRARPASRRQASPASTSAWEAFAQSCIAGSANMRSI